VFVWFLLGLDSQTGSTPGAEGFDHICGIIAGNGLAIKRRVNQLALGLREKREHKTNEQNRSCVAAGKDKCIAGRLSEGDLGDAGRGPHAHQRALARELKVTPPAVTAALKRMTRDGHVRVERSGRIDLTQKGRKLPNTWRCGISSPRCC